MMRRSMRVWDSRGGPTGDANERLRASWSNGLRWSMVLAAALHAVLFMVWPEWTRSFSFVRGDVQEIRLEWIAYEAPPADQSGISPIALPVDEELESDLGGGDEGTATEAEIRERLNELFAERLPEGEFPTPVTADHNPTTSDRDASDAVLPPPTLSMDRLTAVMPELALTSGATVWPLVRNPAVITRFLRHNYRQVSPELEEDQVWVSVAMWVDERGSVEWVEVLDSSGASAVDDIAVDMFRDVAQFNPGRSGGIPTPRSMVISVAFPF